MLVRCFKSLWCAGVVAPLLFVGVMADAALAETRSLTFYNTHSKERATVVYKRNGRYDSGGLRKLNHLMRDWRRNEPTKMDPQLFDIIWEVYRQTGATQPIYIVSGYRSPATNNMLRKRSRGVAKSSLHMKGQAMDFYIPGVPLAKLRAAGLRLQSGGVGYYPSSGSPFVHMDTGSVRHWPRMTRKQLVEVFPRGGSLHVPTDGKPLPGYAKALAAYKLRQARGVVVAPASDGPSAETITVAASDIPAPRSSPQRAVSTPLPPVRVAEAPTAGGTLLSYDGIDRLIATAEPLDVARIRAAQPELVSHEVRTPAVPTALAVAMAERDSAPVASPTASVPIPPTAVVATIDIRRPLRAEAMTTAVMRGTRNAREETGPPVLAFAAPLEDKDESDVARPVLASAGIRLPLPNPLRAERQSPSAATIALVEPGQRIATDQLTLTALDTQGLRLLIATQSTRERRYALLTMPDFNQVPGMLDNAGLDAASHFGPSPNETLRTDRFSVSVDQSSAIADLRRKLAVLSAQ